MKLFHVKCGSAAHSHSRSAVIMVTFALLCCCGGSGCVTGIKAREVAGRDAGNGLRYFLPAPYLVITEAAGGQWDATIKYGVDRSREFYVQPTAFFAVAKTEVEFNEDGTLKSFKLNGDTTAVPGAVVAALKDLELERLKLEREAIAARKKAAEGAESAMVNRDERGGQQTRGADERVFAVYQIKGDRLAAAAHAPPPASASVLEHIDIPPAADAGQRDGELSPPVGINGDGNVEVVRSPLVPEGSLLIRGVDGSPLDEADGDKLAFYSDEQGTTSVAPDRRDAIRQKLNYLGDARAFAVPEDELQGVRAIGLPQ